MMAGRFKRELTILLVAVLGLVWSVALYLVSCSVTIKERCGQFVAAVDYLQGIVVTRACLHRQLKEIGDSLTVDDPEGRNEYLRFGMMAEGAMATWKGAITRQDENGVPGEEEDLARYEAFASDYRRWKVATDHLFTLKATGRAAAARRLFLADGNRLFEERLTPLLEESRSDGIDEVNSAFHALIMTTGRLPLFAEEGGRRVQAMQAIVDHFLAMNQLNAAVDRQIEVLCEALLNRQGYDERLLDRYIDDGEQALVLLRTAEQRRATLDRRTADEAGMAALQRKYRQFTASAHWIVAHRRSADRQTLYRITEEVVEPLFDDTFIPGITKGLDDGSRDVLAIATNLRWGAVTGALLVSILFTAALGRFHRRVCRALDRLHAGTEALSAGDLSYRIELLSADEFGRLARSFNGMAERLAASRAALATLNRDLERRVNERTRLLEAANSDLRQFCSILSHDLRSPVTEINGYLQLILDDGYEALDENSREMFWKCLHASHRMDALIEAQLALACISASELVETEVDLTALAAKVIDELRRQDPDRTVAWDVMPGLAVRGDARLLESVLENLLGNAWKYTARQPAPAIVVGATGSGDRRVFFVRDNGIGFAPEEADKLFKPFSRLHERAGFSGTGIGLASVARIIARHGGAIWAEGSPGAGATFSFTIGAPRPAAEE
ncbi:two-component sensor histidine kinase [Geotalea uraniireducens]|uniref:histidine kinase n=1 Tax=Geotalea uraniireducens TaxID=351604 RepID=A0ABM8EP50_9BACT|nr:ATP-binding protein [Geotalea uraniireducens]BDV44392.1 two-component sensor histidine kinase [Geotalea uraniireducens]